MINYPVFRSLFFVLVFITLLLIYFSGWSYVFLLAEIGLFFIITFAFSFFIQSNFYIKAVCCIPNERGKIAISFDDGPVQNVTPQVLDVLAKFNAKATFFCIGKNIVGNENIIARMHNEGHQIGNHSFSHSHFFGFFSSKKIQKELRQTANAIQSITGEDTRIFRPPFGITNPELKKALVTLGYTLIGWRVRTYDGTLKNEKLILRNATQHLKSGDIVLFHDNYPQIANVLEHFLIHISDRGLQSVRIDQLQLEQIGI